MYLLSAQGYINAGVEVLKIRKTGEIWPCMKDWKWFRLYKYI